MNSKIAAAVLCCSLILTGISGCGTGSGQQTGSAAGTKTENAASSSAAADLSAEAQTGGDTADDSRDEYITGGTTDRTDADAPKEIVSKDIASFDASFILFTRWTADEDDNAYHFTVQPDESGVLTAKEEYRGISLPADGELLAALQEVIDAQELASMNGIYRVTAGLAPEYQPGGLTVRYQSGETLSFTTDNNPYALWSEQTYDVFAAWFAARDNRSLYPSEELGTVTGFMLEYTEEGLFRRYCDTTVSERFAIDEETHLLERYVYDSVTSVRVSEQHRLIPDDYFSRVSGIVSSYSLVRKYDFSRYDHAEGDFGHHDRGYYGFAAEPVPANESDAANRLLVLRLQCDSGETISIETAKISEIEGMKPMITELLDYNSSLFY